MKEKTLIIFFGVELLIVIALAYSSMSVGALGPSTGLFKSGNTEVTEVQTPFAIDAWGNLGWDSCTTMSGGNANANRFCQCKGYDGLYNNGTSACYKVWNNSRWSWTINNSVSSCTNKGSATGAGYGTTTIRCFKYTSNKTQNAQNYTLYFSKNTYGIVSSSPSGITCGTPCFSTSASFASGTSVTLTAVKQVSNWVFTGWGGACSGTALTCTLSMNSDKNVTATFTKTCVAVATPFAVDAWGNSSWTTCTTMAGGISAANNFCKCKGYSSACNNGTDACDHEWANDRWNWNVNVSAAPTCGTKVGNSTFYGLGVTQIKCI